MHFSTLLSFLFFFLPLLTLAAPNNCLILVPGDDEPTFEAAWARDGVGNYSSYQYVNFIEVSSGGERIPVLSAAGDGSSDGRELCITAEGRLYVFEGYPYEPAPSDVSYPVIVPGWKETWVLGRAGRNGTKGFSVDGDYNLDFKSATIYGCYNTELATYPVYTLGAARRKQGVPKGKNCTAITLTTLESGG